MEPLWSVALTATAVALPRKPAHQQFDTLQTIQECAFDLFGRFGYEGVSIGHIADAAKLSKGALYWHFKGKEALYLDCLKQLHSLFYRYVFEPMRTEPDPARGILALFEGLQRLLQDPRVENGVAGYWLTPSTRETQSLIAAQRAFEADTRKVIEETLRRGVDRGHFDLGGDLEDFASAVIAIAEACLLPLRHQSPDEVGRILGVLARTLFRAYARQLPADG